MDTPVEVGQTEAEIALLLEKEIDKRVLQVLYKVFAPHRLTVTVIDGTLGYSDTVTLAESIIDAGLSRVEMYAKKEIKDALYKITQTL